MMRKAIFVVAIVAIVVSVWSFPRAEQAGGGLKIGTPDDLNGLFISYFLREKGIAGQIVSAKPDILLLKDCCTSTTQWALSSEQLDVAVLCPDAARTLVEKDSRYEIVGPLLVNSDMIVVREPPQDIPRIGIGQNRSYQAEMAVNSFGRDCKTISMLYTALPYAMEKREVDGIVIDVLRGWQLAGEKRSGAGGGPDIISSVLVVKKSLRQDARFSKFIVWLAEAAAELNRREVLEKELARYKGLTMTQEEWTTWNRLKIKFVFTTDATPE